MVSQPFAIALSLVSRRLAFTPKQEPVQQVESLENEKNGAGQTKHNFHYNLWEMEKGGAKTRYQWNMDAIRTLKQIESENRLATPEEQKTLSKFFGWGGLSQAFDENNAGWSKEYAELKDLLSDEEYSAARATVNNAFYTSPEIAMCINSALVQFGFRGGNVLEPSMGIGNFFGSMPAPMQRSKLYGVELDSISGRIAKQLYQNANISITGFENTTYPDNFFDVVVGNVPFGDYKVFDPKYNKYNFRIHDYFLAKALFTVALAALYSSSDKRFLSSAYSLLQPAFSSSNACDSPPHPTNFDRTFCSSGVASLFSDSICFRVRIASIFHWYLVLGPPFSISQRSIIRRQSRRLTGIR